MNPSASSYSPSKIIDTIDKYAEALEDFVLKNGDEICNTKILDIRVPKGQSQMIDIDEIKAIANRRRITITIGEI